MNTLITSAGRRVSLVSYFMKESKVLFGESAKVYTTDLNPEMSSACLISDGGITVGKFTDENYMQSIIDICKEHNIKVIIPTLDPELQLLAEHRERLLDIGIYAIVSDTSFIKICRDKRLMNKFFTEHGFKIPAKIDRQSPTFPLFIKPIDGSSSKDLFLIKNKTMLSEYHIQNEKLMFMEYLSPSKYEEYTIDLYYDKNSNLKCVVPRVRLAVRGGETNKGITAKNKLVDIINEKLSHISGARGCLTLQVFLERNGDEIYGIEINPRFGGGYPLSYLAGANYPSWIYKEYIRDEEILPYTDWKDNLLLLRYDHEMTIKDYKGWVST